MVLSQYWCYIVFCYFVQRSSIRWNNGAVIDEYFPIIYENWKHSITSIYKYLLALFGQYWQTQITKNTKNNGLWSFLLALSLFKLGCSWEGRKTLFLSSKEKDILPLFFSSKENEVPPLFLSSKENELSYQFSFLVKD